MIAHVILAKRGTLHLPYFDYNVPPELEKTICAGQLVTIPFRTRIEWGIILSLAKTEAGSKTKDIIKIISPFPLIPPPQLAYLQEISELYHISLGFLVKSNLLPLKKRKLATLNERKPKFKPTKIKPTTKPSNFIYRSDLEKQNYLLQTIKKNEQTLILVPEVNDCLPLQALIEKTHPGSSVVITSSLTEKELFERWIAVWLNEKTVIIGTRGAIFLPFNKLHTVIIDNEGHDGHKSWDMAPRYHVRDAVFFMAKHHGANVHLLSHTPSIETYFFAKHGVYQSEPIALLPFEHKKYSLLNVSAERRGGNTSQLSADVIETLQAGGTVFLFCHRRGTMSYISCRDCQKVITCPKCERSLTFHRPTNNLRCHHCAYNQPMRPNCEKCNGINLALYGIGTDYVVQEIKKLLPNDKRPIITIDQDSENITIPDTAGLIVGTQYAWRFIPWEKLAAMVIVDADTPLFVPEYRTAERLWLELRDMLYRLPKKSPLLIQTNHPEHPLFAALSEPDIFYQQEIAQRKLLKYPPYRYLLKLVFGHLEETIVKKETLQAFETLTRLTKDIPDCTITSPYSLEPAYNKGRHWQAILIKLPYSAYKKYWRQIVALLPDSCKVDPNPLTIFIL